MEAADRGVSLYCRRKHDSAEPQHGGFATARFFDGRLVGVNSISVDVAGLTENGGLENAGGRTVESEYLGRLMVSKFNK